MADIVAERFIARTTLSAATSTVTFTGIPGSYTDLVLITNVGHASSDATVYQFNGDTGSNYSRTYLSSFSTTGNSGRNTAETWINLQNQDVPTTSVSQVQVANIMNYSNSTTYKTVIGRSNVGSAGVTATVGLWRNTAAITSITIRTASVNFVAGSTFTLYGIV